MLTKTMMTMTTTTRTSPVWMQYLPLATVHKHVVVVVSFDPIAVVIQRHWLIDRRSPWLHSWPTLLVEQTSMWTMFHRCSSHSDYSYRWLMSSSYLRGHPRKRVCQYGRVSTNHMMRFDDTSWHDVLPWVTMSILNLCTVCDVEIPCYYQPTIELHYPKPTTICWCCQPLSIAFRQHQCFSDVRNPNERSGDKSEVIFNVIFVSWSLTAKSIKCNWEWQIFACSVSVCFVSREIVNTLCERLLSLFIAVSPTVRFLVPIL
jgi:hypothetical protein